MVELPRQTPLFQVAFGGFGWNVEFLGGSDGGLLVEVGRQGDEVLLFELVFSALGCFRGLDGETLYLCTTALDDEQRIVRIIQQRTLNELLNNLLSAI